MQSLLSSHGGGLSAALHTHMHTTHTHCQLWPLLSELCTKHKESVRVIERICR